MTEGHRRIFRSHGIATTLRRLAFAVAVVLITAAAAEANSLLLCGWAGCELFILGPHTPNPRSSPHMSFRIRPGRTTAGGTFHATARGFIPREYVTIWDYTARNWRGHAAELPGGNATPRGIITFVRETMANITKLGMHKICLQGERSRRVACATYRVLPAGPVIGPGYVPPSSGPGWTPPIVGPGYVPPGTA